MAHNYLVYTYQYAEMRKPRTDAVNVDGMLGTDAVDLMPPTVTDFRFVYGLNSKREAIAFFKGAK